MKKIILMLLVAAFAINLSYSQNTYPWPSTGNVGIGTTSPPRKLVISNSGNEGLEIGPGNLVGDAAGAVTSVYYNRNSGAFIDNVQAAASHVFAINGTTPAMIINSSGNVGVGTTSPITKFHAKGAGASFPANSGTTPSSGTVTRLQDGTNLVLDIGGYGANGFWMQSTDQTNLASTYPIFFNPNGGSVGIGTTNTQGYTFAVNGAAIATAITVKAYGNWPDYVFKPTYHLPTLNEIKAYIDQNHHLPDMPTEAEVVKNGLKVGETEALLTKKVEELTLYLIEKDKQVNTLQDEVQQLKQQVSLLINKSK